MKPLKLTVRAIRVLQETHGISNLLQPTEADAVKMACLDFLASFCYEGSRSWENPPSREEVEDFEIGAILKAVKDVLSGEAPGKD
jgi:hypothetical protein